MSGASTISQTPTYEDFYGFVEPPFTLAPDPRFFYRSESHDDAITGLLQAIGRREGLIVLAGEVGTGKTTICRALLEQLDQATFTSLVLNPFLSVEELLRDILLDFGVVSREAVRSGRIASATRHELISVLHEFLLSLTAIRGSGVLIVDEAQHLPPEALEQIRVMSNPETNQSQLLQIVLVGQLNLLDVLDAADMRQLDQRISLRKVLKPLKRAELQPYIAHRLAVAGGPQTLTFEPAALDVVHVYSGGVPRVINQVCDGALTVAAESRAATVTPEFIDAAAGRLELARPAPANPAQRARIWMWSGVAAAAIALLTVTVVLLAPLYRLVDVDAPLPAPPPPPATRPAIAAPIAPLPVPNVVIPTPRNLLLIPGYR